MESARARVDRSLAQLQALLSDMAVANVQHALEWSGLAAQVVPGEAEAQVAVVRNQLQAMAAWVAGDLPLPRALGVEHLAYCCAGSTSICGARVRL